MRRTGSSFVISGRERPRGAVAIAVLLALGLLALPVLGHAFPGGDFTGSQQRGKAYGAKGALTHATLPKVTIGEVALQTFPCNPAPGAESAKTSDELVNHVALLDVVLPTNTKPLLVKAAKIRNSGYFETSETKADVYEQSTTGEISLLDGRITAKAVEANAHTTLSATGIDHHTTIDSHPGLPGEKGSHSKFVELVIDEDGPGPKAAKIVGDDVKPNTKFLLDGIGYVVLNEQRLLRRSGFEVNAIHLYIFDDGTTAAKESFFGYTGDLIVAHAQTRLADARGRLSGYAHATTGSVDPFLKHGRQAFIGINCGGTKGIEKETTQVGFDTGSVGGSAFTSLLSSSTMRSTVQGDVGADSAYSRSTSTIEALRIFTNSNGLSLIRADAVKSVARTDGTPGGVVSTGAESMLVNLEIDSNGDGIMDRTFNGSAEPNTRINLDGIGYVILNEWRCRDTADPSLGTTSCGSVDPTTNANTNYNKIIVTQVLVRITVPGNPTGLPQGAEFKVAVAESDVAF